MGLTVGASHRIVSEGSRIAMPEIHIGLFPDVGGGWFLNRLPGGTGTRFDWSLLKNHRHNMEWGIAGGLTPDNVAQAIAETGAPLVDVSSGVESAPGVKDMDKIAAFLKAAGR